MFDKFSAGLRLMKCFPNSFINSCGEFIAHRYANESFILDNCKNEEDVKFKVLAWFSRGAHKSQPYASQKKNDDFHRFMLNGINEFLSTKFTEQDISMVYDRFGNGCNEKECRAFINRGFDMNMLKKDGDEK